jgi:hypothetical protein
VTRDRLTLEAKGAELLRADVEKSTRRTSNIQMFDSFRVLDGTRRNED